MGSHRNDAYNAQQQQRQSIFNTANTSYKNSQEPSGTEQEMVPISQNFMNNYNTASTRNMADYGDLMKGFSDYSKNAKFGFERVQNERPAELGESYGYLREAMPGYREFAANGGYSDKDQQELRARGMSPIRSAYGNTMMQLDRARSLGGNGGATNYIAAASRAQRELPGQMADAMTGVNANLAEQIRSGKLQGLEGMTRIGGTMGGLADSDANRSLHAATSNQAADMQTQMNEDSAKRFGISGQSQLYGTTPGLSSTFGNQALQAYNTRAGMESSRNQYGLGLINAQLSAMNPANDQKQKPWWQSALGFGANLAGNVLGAYAGAPGGRI